LEIIDRLSYFQFKFPTSSQINFFEEMVVSVEYSKTNKAVCQSCSHYIAEGSIRVGTNVPGYRGSGWNKKWSHFNCWMVIFSPFLFLREIEEKKTGYQQRFLFGSESFARRRSEISERSHRKIYKKVRQSIGKKGQGRWRIFFTNFVLISLNRSENEKRNMLSKSKLQRKKKDSKKLKKLDKKEVDLI
jgi:hypothetical protein